MKSPITKGLLQKVFKAKEYIELEDKILYSDLELYNTKTEEEKYYNSIDELLEDKELYKELSQITFEFIYTGGRGGRYLGAMGGGFTSYGGRIANTKYLFPAEFNVKTARASQEKTLKRFIKKYGNSDREYGITVDEQGFVHQHARGGKGNVYIYATGKNQMIAHNHPGGGNFSKADLLVAASDKNSSGIIATSSKRTYSMRKTEKFNAKEFSKGVSRAKWPVKYDYDKGASWWLRRNQKKYGYKFSDRKSE